MENVACLFVCLIFSRSAFSLGPLSLHRYLNNSIKSISVAFYVKFWTFFFCQKYSILCQRVLDRLKSLCVACLFVFWLLCCWGFFSLIIRVFLHSCRQLSVLQTSWIQGSSCSKVMWQSYWKREL